MSEQALGPPQRAEAWDQLGSEQFDVVVIGGGVVGAGAALDAATRGLKVALVEARDFASGTSSRSSKMFHGGLRYLEQLEFGLVREALHERELSLTTLAPHLVKPLPFLFPLTKRVWERPYIAAGHLPLRPAGRGEIRPSPAASDQGRGAAAGSGTQAQLADRRYPLLRHRRRRRPAHHDGGAHRGALRRGGAHLHPGGRAAHRGRPGGRCDGARLGERGGDRGARSRGDQRDRGVDRRDPGAVPQRGRFRVRASKGVHIVVPRDRIVSEVAIILRTEKSVLFVIPWGTHWIIGTTDTDWNLDLAHPAATKADIDYILGHVNTVLATPLTHDDIDGVYAGLRPLLAGESEETSKLSREHAVAVPDARPGRDRGRQVHHLPGDGGRRRRRGGRVRTVPGRAVDHREGAAAGRRRLLRADQPDRPCRRGIQPAPLPGAAPAGPVRFADRRGAGPGRRTARSARADRRGAGVSAGRGRLCRCRRGRPAPRGHPGPTDADLDRVPAPRCGLCPRGRRDRRPDPGLGAPRTSTARSPPTSPGSRPRCCPRARSTTRPPTRCGSPRRRRGRRSSNRCP